jgi:hypothetical protein
VAIPFGPACNLGLHIGFGFRQVSESGYIPIHSSSWLRIPFGAKHEQRMEA